METKPTFWVYVLEDHDALVVQPPAEGGTLEALQLLVGGLIESVPVIAYRMGFACDGWVNEEGLYRPDFAYNRVASFISGRDLVGPCVLTGHDGNGKTIGIRGTNISYMNRDGWDLRRNGSRPFTVREAAVERFEVAAARIAERTAL